MAAALLWLLIAFAAPVIRAQGTFISGSTGVDGDFSPTTNTTVSQCKSIAMRVYLTVRLASIIAAGVEFELN